MTQAATGETVRVRIIGDELKAFGVDMDLPKGFNIEDETILERIAQEVGIYHYGAEGGLRIDAVTELDADGEEIFHPVPSVASGSWTPAFSEAATAEGWDLFSLDGFQYDIEAVDDQRDEPNGILDDDAAVKFVTQQAQNGAAHAIMALALQGKCSTCEGLLPDTRYIERGDERRPSVGHACTCKGNA